MHIERETDRIAEMLHRERAFWDSGIMHVAGVDEAGRGPLAGPVVAAAVMFSPGVAVPGIDDSKVVKPAVRERLYDAIRASAIAVGVGVVDVEAIDRVNILNAAISAMHDAIDELRPTPAHMLIDGKFFYHEHIPFTTIVDGDARCYSIAAASIIAKVTRDRIMVALDAQYPGYGFAQHKGYGTKAHYAALRRIGPCAAHRRSFIHLDTPAPVNV